MLHINLKEKSANLGQVIQCGLLLYSDIKWLRIKILYKELGIFLLL